MAQKKYVSLSKLETFLTKLKSTFASLTHTHTISDITDYSVDSTLSSTSTNPIQNKVINEEFDAIADAMNVLEASIDTNLSTAKAYADAGDTTTLEAAKEYADGVKEIIYVPLLETTTDEGETTYSLGDDWTFETVKAKIDDGYDIVLKKEEIVTTDTETEAVETRTYFAWLSYVADDNITFQIIRGHTTHEVYDLYSDGTITYIKSDNCVFIQVVSSTSNYKLNGYTYEDIINLINKKTEVYLYMIFSNSNSRYVYKLGGLVEYSNYDYPVIDFTCDYNGTARKRLTVHPESKYPDGNVKYSTFTLANANNVMTKLNPTGSGSFSLNRKSGTTIGGNSVAIGYNSIATGTHSVAIGSYTQAIGNYSHAEGCSTIASGTYSHAEGYNTIASDFYSHAEGYGEKISVNITGDANATQYTLSKIDESYVGRVITYNNILTTITAVNVADKSITVSTTLSDADLSEVSGYIYTGATSRYAHAEGGGTLASNFYSHAEGHNTTASGRESHAEGYNTIASGQYSHSEGDSTIASSYSSHAEGDSTVASNIDSHAEGYRTTASGQHSHAEGSDTTASGKESHAEGYRTTASGDYSHATGFYTVAFGSGSHAEGAANTFIRSITGEANSTQYTISSTALLYIGTLILYNNTYAIITNIDETNKIITVDKTLSTTELVSVSVHVCYGCAYGNQSHVEGTHTIALGDGQHVQGKYNLAGNTSAHVVGNGTSNSNRSNAHTLDWTGNAWFAGDVYVGSTSGTNKDEGSVKLTAIQFITLESGD